ncbi:nuclear transport factor 2 family protein [Mycobacterium sp. DL592]|uniref:nuclear transport factor 2 family protein n=1 Tax=Mycobacterium sp. DL592 TaxID=2675524 RepID=UPI0014239715|nr:nuclear transport factor 2 family protein [Mycobacterium sp. DL592]
MSGSFDRVEIARAFSQHRFQDALPHLAADVRWTIVGYSVLEGADAVARTCRDTAGSLGETVADWDHCLVVEQGDTVVVEVHGRYTGQQTVTSVATCYLYTFTDDRIAAITSYAVEVDPESVGSPPNAIQR